jgi:hypothetical protein
MGPRVRPERNITASVRPLRGIAVIFAVLAFAVSAAQAADPVEAFLQRWEDPRLFDARDLDPAFQAEVNGGGQSIILNRDQTIAFNERIREIITAYSLKSFKILDRKEADGQLVITYATLSALSLRGQPLAVEETTTVTLRRGGPNGFSVLHMTSHQKNVAD